MTPHIEANINEIANIVLMPGDPLRAKYIAKKYLKKEKLVNEVRGMLAYTGYYKGVKVTVMASGMGNPSMGIYSYELFSKYNVDTIIRIGSCGSYVEKLNIGDIILVTKSVSASSYAYLQNGYSENNIKPSSVINTKIIETANNNGIKIIQGAIFSSDTFYEEENNYEKRVKNYETLGVEMESFALFHNARVLNKNAACILTVSDSFLNSEELTSKEREQGLNKMIELALDTIINLKEE